MDQLAGFTEAARKLALDRFLDIDGVKHSSSDGQRVETQIHGTYSPGLTE